MKSEPKSELEHNLMHTKHKLGICTLFGIFLETWRCNFPSKHSEKNLSAEEDFAQSPTLLPMCSWNMTCLKICFWGTIVNSQILFCFLANGKGYVRLINDKLVMSRTMFDVCLSLAKNGVFEYNYWKMNTFESVECLKNLCLSMFDE